jgi:hypothetical protein
MSLRKSRYRPHLRRAGNGEDLGDQRVGMQTVEQLLAGVISELRVVVLDVTAIDPSFPAWPELSIHQHPLCLMEQEEAQTTEIINHVRQRKVAQLHTTSFKRQVAVQRVMGVCTRDKRGSGHRLSLIWGEY